MITRNTKIQTGIVGAGLMGRWHADAALHAGGRVVAVMDLDGAAAKNLAERYSPAASYTDIGQMLSETKLDVLHICTPLDTHYSVAETGLLEGCHLLIEKPATSTSAQLELLYQLAAESGLLMCPVHQFTCQDGMQKAKAWMPEIGRVVQMGVSIRSAGGAAHPESALDEIVTDILPHPLSIMDEIGLQDLHTAEWAVVKPGEGELHAIAEVDGISLSISISMNGRPTANDFEIVGTKGIIHLDLFHGYAFRESGYVSKTRKITHPFDLASRRIMAASINLGRRALRREPAYPGLRRFVRLFYATVQGKGALPISEKSAMDVAYARDSLRFSLTSEDLNQ